MTPEMAAHYMYIINISIIVLVSTICYSFALLIYRVVKMVKRWSDSEQEFMNSTYFRLKLEQQKRTQCQHTKQPSDPKG